MLSILSIFVGRIIAKPIQIYIYNMTYTNNICNLYLFYIAQISCQYITYIYVIHSSDC